MNLKVNIVCVAIALSGCGGCTDAPPAQARSDVADSIPIEQRYHSITGRILKGMSMAHAKAFLGDCTRARFHGPHTDLSTGITTNYEEWTWVVDASNGQIVVHSTSGLESDLNHGVVASVSYAKKFPVRMTSNGVETANKDLQLTK